MKYKKDVLAFLATVKREKEYVEWDFKGRKWNPVCFWSQQMAEKALKALWAYYERKPIKIHKLEALINGIEDKTEKLIVCLAGARFLDQFYLETRYPGASGEELKIDEQMARKAMTAAEKITRAVRRLIKF